MLALKTVAVWSAILVCAVANGALREAVLIPHLGKAAGLVLSGLLLSGLILVVAYAALPWLRARRRQLPGIGLAWLALTLGFELSFDLLRGTPWPAILESYTFKDGNIWPVVLLVTATAPYIAGRLRGTPQG
ncbi:hypothetical protein [Luteimonas saliphila]|uniref:hypothetical protein n=1 Tax=Luteimonas saliphila TaxID=2804919 RepID=UPI00192D258F|nr:hypothetical protein [Luteimonas saliphila]